MGVPSTRRRANSLALLIVVTLVVGLVPAAGAAPDHKSFTTSIEPSSATAGTPVAFALTINNTSDSAPLGASRITVPDGFVVNSAEFGGNPNWSLKVAGNTVSIVANDSESRLAPGESILVTVDAVTPLQGGDDSYQFGVEARQANNFNGKRNDLSGQGPSVEITGAAVACLNGNSCELGLSEGKTNVNVSTLCPETGCGNLIVDLDQDYCGGEACVGEGVLWVPPVQDDGGRVTVVLEIPKSAVAGGAGQVKFFIAATGSEQAFECGDHPTIDCSYHVSGGRSSITITAIVERVDPRGFAS